MRLIDADKVQKPIYAEEDNITGFGMTYDEMCGYNDGIDVTWGRIELAPTVDAVEVVHGHWISEDISYGLNEYGFDSMVTDYRCSKCGEYVLYDEYLPNYCPNCGAKMDEVKE